MSIVHGNCARLVVIGSTVVYLSAGVALYYLYKKYRDRQNKSKIRRKSKRSSSLSGKNSRLDKESPHYNSQSDLDTEDESGQLSDTFELDQDSSSNLTKVNNQKVLPPPCNNSTEIITDVCDASKVKEANAATVNEKLEENEIGFVAQFHPTTSNESFLLTSENLDKNNINNLGHETQDEYYYPSAAADSYIQSCDGEVSSTMIRMIKQQHSDSEGDVTLQTHSKNDCANSPSVSSDSELSQDSGKGASMGLTNSTSPVNDLLIELPPMYEFEVPQDIVGLIIGRKGTTIKYFTEESGAHIVIRHHHFSNKHKICTIEGTRDQINKCLRLIRHKFPPSRFPELKLTPLLPPPVVSPHSPVFDSIINLNLPEGVNCEVTLSSMVDAGHFFVQQPTHPTFPSLTKLDQYLLAVYSQAAGVPGLPRPIENGIICIAPVLGGWYRAQTVAAFEETDEVLVRFVDYGGYSRISAADLRQIRSDFMNLPFQAIECGLAYVKPINESEGWSAEANTYFEQCVHGKLAETVLVAKDRDTLTSMVELFCLIEGEMEMINRLLVYKGYAIWHNIEPNGES